MTTPVHFQVILNPLLLISIHFDLGTAGTPIVNATLFGQAAMNASRPRFGKR